MKITIPEEHRGRFKSERAWIKPKGGGDCIVQDYTPVFISRWKGHSSLLMNIEERNQLMSHLDAEITREGKDGAFLRLMKAGITQVMLIDDVIEAPKWLTGWLGDGEFVYEKDNWGIVLKVRK